MSDLIAEDTSLGKKWSLYRTGNGWEITCSTDIYVGNRLWSTTVEKRYSIEHNAGREIYMVYISDQQVPVSNWLKQFDIVPTKGNGASKAFVHNFKRYWIPSQNKTTIQAEKSKHLGKFFKIIACDYILCFRGRAFMFHMIWFHCKDSLPAKLPRDIMKIILELIREP